MGTLDGVIRMEYGSEMVENNESSEKAMQMVSSIFSEKELEEFTNLLLKSEYFMFQQGFIRGIAAEMAGAV